MSKLFLFLFLLFLCSVHFAGSFERPWNDKTWVSTNPYIWNYWGNGVWWNIPELDKSLDSIDLEHVKLTNSTPAVSDSIAQASSYRAAAKFNLQVCTQSNLISSLWGLGIFQPFSIMYDLISEFLKIPSCLAYGSNWKWAVDNSLSAIEYSITEADHAVEGAVIAYDDLSFTGICDYNYTYAGSENCAEISSAFDSVIYGISDDRYGRYSLLQEYSDNLDYQLNRPAPSLTNVNSILTIVWGENSIVSSFNDLTSKAKNSKNRAEDQFLLIKKIVEDKRKIAKTEIKELESHDLDLISESYSAFEAHSPGSIGDLFSQIKQRDDQLSLDFDSARLGRERSFQRGYLAGAIIGMFDVDSGYDLLIEDIQSFENLAMEALNQKIIEANNELELTREFTNSSAKSSETITLLEQAENYCRQGESESTIGKKFMAYSKCASSARAARSERTYEEEIAIKSSIDQLELLIHNAEKDEINVISEKESLALLEKLNQYQITDAIDSCVSNIILKARAKYDIELLELRQETYKKLLFAGPSAADLYTDLERYENSIIQDDLIVYPQSIGKLKTLKQNYQTILSELDQYMEGIIGNSMSTNGNLLISDVWLDKPATITLDLVVVNKLNYSGQHIPVKISLDAQVPFLYSDIIQGKDDIENLRIADDGNSIILTFSSVVPFETKRVILEKQTIIAHTENKDSDSFGIGNDAAHVEETIKFSLDIDIPQLYLPKQYDGALIDGTEQQRALSAGKHELYSKHIIDSAYLEEITNIRSYRVGTNSIIEYDIRITPNIDLNRVIVFLDSLNDSRMSSMNLAASTGEEIKDKKRVSETQYTARVYGLDAGRITVLKASYSVADTQSFVSEQITLLESANMSIESGSLFEQAKETAALGDYNTALELIEKSKALLKTEEKEVTKLQKQYNELSIDLNRELSEIQNSLVATNISAPFIDKLTTRAAELERISEESKTENLTGNIAVLETVDGNWVGKELTSLKKDIYKQYNDLKERFYDAGNSDTPNEFLIFESALNRLETGERLEYAVEAIGALNDVRSLVADQESLYEDTKTTMKSSFETMKTELEKTLDIYVGEAAAAKGTDYSSLFTESEKSVEKIITDAENAIDEDPKIFEIKLNSMNKSQTRLQMVLISLKSEAEAKVSLMENLVSQPDLDEKSKIDFTDKISAMKQMLAAGQYVNTLRAGSTIAKELDEFEPRSQNNLLFLGLTALVLLAVSGFYLMKQHEKTQGSKVLKKLKKSDETKPISDHQDLNISLPKISNKKELKSVD
ncbi:hypothetical protein KKF81_05690 [Candidatus Micrarchaeota archaeon]|nr:hypothetical protein [Candidatus Micrarchaeota archaeon]